MIRGHRDVEKEENWLLWGIMEFGQGNDSILSLDGKGHIVMFI